MKEKTTQQRSDAMKASPGLYNAMKALQNYVDDCGLERRLLELVKIRASQINGCAYCLVMHTNDARKLGDSDERMHLLNAWREAPVFNARERAALAWTEAVTLISADHAPDEVYDEARRQFSEKELVDLTAAVVAINGWNRIAIAFRTPPRVASENIAAYARQPAGAWASGLTQTHLAGPSRPAAIGHRSPSGDFAPKRCELADGPIARRKTGIGRHPMGPPTEGALSAHP